MPLDSPFSGHCVFSKVKTRSLRDVACIQENIVLRQKTLKVFPLLKSNSRFENPKSRTMLISEAISTSSHGFTTSRFNPSTLTPAVLEVVDKAEPKQEIPSKSSLVDLIVNERCFKTETFYHVMVQVQELISKESTKQLAKGCIKWPYMREDLMSNYITS